MFFSFRKRTNSEIEDSWLAGAVAGSVIVAVCAAFIAAWVFNVDADSDRLIRMQIWAPIGVLAVAAITFATVVWRGLISARQADTSLQQLEGLRKQIQLSEESNLGDLMLKGAELIAEEADAKQAAGIATLEVVASAPGSKFADPSRRLLADILQKASAPDHRGKVAQQVIRALNNSFEKNKLITSDILRFGTDNKDPKYATYWSIVKGIAHAFYENGTIEYSEIKSGFCDKYFFKNIQFNDCSFDDTSISIFAYCHFKDCRFGKIKTSLITDNYFSNCDFSGTEIFVDGEIVRNPIKAKLNSYFDIGNPPKVIGLPAEHKLDWLEAMRENSKNTGRPNP